METNQTPTTKAEATEAAETFGHMEPHLLQSEVLEIIRAMAQANSAENEQHGSSNGLLRELSFLADLQFQIEAVKENIIDLARTTDGGANSWADIGDAIGVSRQAAQQKY